MISIKSHRIFDYFYGVLLIAFPSIFRITGVHAVKAVFFWCGTLFLITALCTQHGPSLIKFISVQVHMKIDLFVGLFLIIAPTIFSYRTILTSAQYEGHVMLGFLIILFVGETRYRHDISIAGPKISLEVG